MVNFTMFTVNFGCANHPLQLCYCRIHTETDCVVSGPAAPREGSRGFNMRSTDTLVFSARRYRCPAARSKRLFSCFACLCLVTWRRNTPPKMSFGSMTAAKADYELPSPPSDGVSDLTFSPNGSLIAAGSWDNGVSVCACACSMCTSPTTDIACRCLFMFSALVRIAVAVWPALMLAVFCTKAFNVF